MLLLVYGARCDYSLEVKVAEYDNSDHKLANGRCCERESSTSGCTPWWCWWCECDMSFKFCMRPPGTDHDDDAGNCDWGRYTTGEVSTNDDRFYFNTPIDGGVPNPMTFSGSVWSVSQDSIYYSQVCVLPTLFFIYTVVLRLSDLRRRIKGPC